MHLMFCNEVSKFNRRLISNISCSESQIVVKLKLTQIETQLRLMSKIRPIAFWKYLYTRHTQNIIWEIFKFLEYFLRMYSFLFSWTFCAIIRIMNWFFSAPRRSACFSFIWLFHFSFLWEGIYVHGIIFLISVAYSVINILRLFFSVRCVKINPPHCLH